MKQNFPLFYIVFALATIGAKKTMGAAPSLSSYTENPNSDSIPMVPAPLELIGSWKGSNCGLNDPELVVAELEMEENGVNVWSFADKDTGILMPQTGEGVEVIVGWQCIDVGKGYWWGQVPYSDVMWCNLFQVEEVNSDDTPKDNNTTFVSYVNLAYGGQGVGALAEGACPTSLTTLEPSTKPLQASFTKKIEATDNFSMTCNVPAGSKDRVQPSQNSQFPSGVAVPNPFSADPIKKARSYTSATNYELPVISKTTCQAKVDDKLADSAAARSSINDFIISAEVASFFFSWIMM